MVKARKYVVKNYFKGEPKRSDFEIVEYELPPLKKDEILIKAEWISVDPYLRAYNVRQSLPYDQYGFQVGIVQETTDSKFPIGTRVHTHNGWCDYSIKSTKCNHPIEGVYKLPDMQGLSPSLGVGVLGMPGVTAYYGLLDICKPKAGETVVVTGAAGAVGSTVGQIAKTKGCFVIGFAGSDDKVQWLENELGFDKAFNYKTVNISKALKEAAPNGIDCYFDNVGGEISSIITYQMNHYGRISVCGSISSYNDDINELPKATLLQQALVFKQLKMHGFLVSEYSDTWHEAVTDMLSMIKAGKITPREQITEGFDKIYDAFSGMLAGTNVGKAVVKV